MFGSLQCALCIIVHRAGAKCELPDINMSLGLTRVNAPLCALCHLPSKQHQVQHGTGIMLPG